jgi:hypothetical protein
VGPDLQTGRSKKQIIIDADEFVAARKIINSFEVERGVGRKLKLKVAPGLKINNFTEKEIKK